VVDRFGETQGVTHGGTMLEEGVGLQFVVGMRVALLVLCSCCFRSLVVLEVELQVWFVFGLWFLSFLRMCWEIFLSFH